MKKPTATPPAFCSVPMSRSTNRGCVKPTSWRGAWSLSVLFALSAADLLRARMTAAPAARSGMEIEESPLLQERQLRRFARHALRRIGRRSVRAQLRTAQRRGLAGVSRLRRRRLRLHCGETPQQRERHAGGGRRTKPGLPRASSSGIRCYLRAPLFRNASTMRASPCCTKMRRTGRA